MMMANTQLIFLPVIRPDTSATYSNGLHGHRHTVVYEVAQQEIVDVLALMSCKFRHSNTIINNLYNVMPLTNLNLLLNIF